MRRTLFLFAVFLVAVFILSGCGTMRMPAGSVFPGLIYSDVNYPSLREEPDVQYRFTAQDITILGPVTAKGSSVNILGLFGTGSNGYETLMEAAKSKYPDADTVININWDTKFTYFGLIYIPIYQRADSTLTGTAIRMKR